jgi:hypothetical protein
MTITAYRSAALMLFTCLALAAASSEDVAAAVAAGSSAADRAKALIDGGTKVVPWGDSKHKVEKVDGKPIAFRYHGSERMTGFLERQKPNGRRSLSHWQDGRLHGPSASWAADGSLESEGWYDGGAWPLVEISYHPNGAVERFMVSDDQGQRTSLFDDQGGLTGSQQAPAGGGKVAKDDTTVDYRPESWKKTK